MKRIAPILSVLALGCAPETTLSPDPTYCGNNDGDAFCAAADPGAPFCVAVADECLEAAGITIDHPNGCVAEMPAPECRQSCGVGNDDNCLDPTVGSDESSTGGETENPSTTVDPDTGSSTDEPTTGPSGCMSDEECTDAEAPFCDPDGNCVACDGMPEPDAACEGADPQAPVCDAGACVQCTEENLAACEGTTPICGVGNTCEGCTEHAQCPESACHLDGADAGACFDAAEVQMVASTGALETAVEGLSADDDAVLVLTGSDYSGLSVDLVAAAEVAILGDGSQTLSGSSSGAFFSSGGSSLVYLAGVTLAGNVSGDGLSCSGSAVWLDDAEVRNNAQVGMDVSGGCEAHLRRTVVAVNNGGGVDIAGGGLYLVNSVVGRNGDDAVSIVGGIAVNGAEVDIRYSTIADNESTSAGGSSLGCNGAVSGEVRNSILSGAGSSIDCAGVTFDGNAADESLGGSNENVGPFTAGWFANLGSNDFTLTASGQSEFMDIAQWEEGDPLFDFEGDAIPTDVPSFPGYDQP